MFANNLQYTGWGNQLFILKIFKKLLGSEYYSKDVCINFHQPILTYSFCEMNEGHVGII